MEKLDSLFAIKIEENINYETFYFSISENYQPISCVANFKLNDTLYPMYD